MTFYSNDLGVETVWNCLGSGLKRGSTVKYSAKQAVWQNLVMEFYREIDRKFKNQKNNDLIV